MKYQNQNPIAKLLPGEIYFFLRAKDADAPDAVKAYADIQEKRGNLEAARECREIASKMESFQKAHPELVRVAD